jgi:phage gp36-like protein
LIEMGYITPEDLAGLVPSALIDDATRDSGALPDEILAAVIGAAETRVHRLLGPRYPRPLRSPIPELVIDAARIFAVYELYARNGILRDDTPRAKDAESAEAQLKEVRDGLVALYADEELSPDSGLVTEPNWVDYPHGTMV